MYRMPENKRDVECFRNVFKVVFYQYANDLPLRKLSINLKYDFFTTF